ncbi:MAG: hypothetical protein UZ13_00434 [Chloroflexi bacterium OLB13]|nr:MAG: hypothetical protein UZ13_00434 [Chloroflexi bacterium OLB13]OQY80088.1 MAG: hypothetical protein B6D42_13715 [Anaerolineae bacterium UTCFX5]
MRDIGAKIHSIAAQGKHLALYVSPRFDFLPIEAQRYDEPLLPYGRLILDATEPYLGAIVFDLAAYAQFGAAGTVALERSIRLFSETTLTIIDGPLVDPAYAAVLDDLSFGPDAITITGDLWDTLVPNARMIVTTGRGFRGVERCDLNIGDATFKLAGSALLEAARSLDFRESLGTAAAAFLGR